eukprot:1340-Heterococcus_DN1.PRE.1
MMIAAAQQQQQSAPRMTCTAAKLPAKASKQCGDQRLEAAPRQVKGTTAVHHAGGLKPELATFFDHIECFSGLGSIRAIWKLSLAAKAAAAADHTAPWNRDFPNE